jgi:hypothetical protein
MSIYLQELSQLRLNSSVPSNECWDALRQQFGDERFNASRMMMENGDWSEVFYRHPVTVVVVTVACTLCSVLGCAGLYILLQRYKAPHRPLQSVITAVPVRRRRLGLKSWRPHKYETL